MGLNRIIMNEPHPTVAKNTYVFSGRGGAGNVSRAPLTTPPTGVPTTVSTVPTNTTSSTTSSSNRHFYSGRGGAGNAYSADQRAPLSFDEDLARAVVRDSAPYMGGRGGAGNFSRHVEAQKERKHSTASMDSASSRTSRRDSSDSAAAGGRTSGLFKRLSKSSEKN